MPKNALTELNEIFVKSQRLTAQQTDAGSTSRHLNRGVSLKELFADSYIYLHNNLGF
jgi:hypothetical protein